MFNGILILLVFVSFVVLTGVIRRYALTKSLLDIPNARSSHEVPTPRGGGLAIVIPFLLSLAVLYWRNVITQQLLFAFVGGGLAVALVGLADDFRHIRAPFRILVHLAACGTGLYFLGGFPPVVIGSIVVDLKMAGDLLSIIFLVWLLNLFNFMDGIDGIAASEAIFIAGGAALIIIITGRGVNFPLLLFIVSCAGFLVWNWPPAKIFMGDVGSGFLGISLGFFIIMTMSTGELSLCTWLILFGFFFIDATVTLLTRISRRQRWYEAHRSHAYQILTRRFGSHRIVTLLILLLNVIWLLPPLAYLSSRYPERSLLVMIIAFVPILYGVFVIGAGKENCSK